jgi:hypothetical protein
VWAHSLQAIADDAIALSVCLGEGRLISLHLNAMVLRVVGCASACLLLFGHWCCLLAAAVCCIHSMRRGGAYRGLQLQQASIPLLQRFAPGSVASSSNAYGAVVDFHDGFASLL